MAAEVPEPVGVAVAVAEPELSENGGAPISPSRPMVRRMPYHPSLGVVAAGAGDAVRLPRQPKPTRSSE